MKNKINTGGVKLVCWFMNDCKKAKTESCNEWCDKYLLYSALVNQSLIPKRYKRCFLDTFPDKKSLQYLITKKYIEGIDSFIASGRGLYLYGGVGTGKTTIATTIANEYMKKIVWTSNLDPHVVYIVVPELLERIKQGFDNPDEALAELLENMETVPLLILDDIGAEKSTDWVMERLYQYINKRYTEELSTIFTSNLDPEQLKDRLGERITSRICGMCDIVIIEGKDHRRG